MSQLFKYFIIECCQNKIHSLQSVLLNNLPYDTYILHLVKNILRNQTVLCVKLITTAVVQAVDDVVKECHTFYPFIIIFNVVECSKDKFVPTITNL